MFNNNIKHGLVIKPDLEQYKGRSYKTELSRFIFADETEYLVLETTVY